MKRILTVLLVLALTNAYTQTKKNLTGVYHSKKGDVHKIILIVDDYCSITTYKDNEYINTWGGPITADNKKATIKVEFNDKQKDKVGQELSTPIELQNGNIKASDELFIKQKSNKQDLDGLWRITGRDQGGTVSTIARGDRKTIKMLVDGYFQWIAINPKEKSFSGTGGGQYKFANAAYTEKIVFFSRDNSRVGAELNFKGEIKDGQWHHSGKSSKGDPIYEIWSRE